MNGQVSLEFLLIIAIFFSALLIILPSVNIATKQIFLANDTILAKQISKTIENEINLFSFLGNGTSKEFEFIPAKQIFIRTDNSKFIISTTQKEFEVNFPNKINFDEREFSTKFFIKIKKENENIKVNFYN